MTDKILRKDLYDQVADVLGKYASDYLLDIESKHYRLRLHWDDACLSVFGLHKSQLQMSELYALKCTVGHAISAARHILKQEHRIMCYKGWLPSLPVEQERALTIFQVNVLSQWIVSICLLPPWKRPK